MRNSFIARLAELAAADERVYFLTADLGYKVVECFQEAAPDRFLNVGVAEQNMLGMATGLAREGYLPFVYSIATFAALRGYEFLRNGPVRHDLPVRVIGVGGGLEYSKAGPSHYAVEDLAVMRTQPRLRVHSPADPAQAVSLLDATWDQPGPAYYRLGKDERVVVPGLDGRYRPGEVEVLGDEGEVALVSTGAIAAEVVAAVAALREAGIGARHVVVADLNPAPEQALAAAIAGCDLVVSVEEHYLVGGLGSLVAEVLAERGAGVRFRRVAIREQLDGRTGSLAWLRSRYRVDAASIVETVREAL